MFGRNFVIGLGFVAASTLHAATFVETACDPCRSRSGEPVRFSIQVRTNSTDYIRRPDFPKALTDWELIREFASPKMGTVYENGVMTVKQENEFTYILSPKRKGTLEIPAVGLSVGSKRYTTQPVRIQVDEVPIGSGGGAARAPRPMPMPTPPKSPDDLPEDPNPLWGPGVPGLPREEDLFDDPSLQPLPQENTYNFAIPGDGRQTFFVKALVKRTTVFVGEMIEVSYRAYTKSRAMREPEITKFPEFKGFLKEDLLIPKLFEPRPVIIQGKSFFETELVRYALFPLKEGSLRIDQMNFKLRMVGGIDRDALAQSLIYGTPFEPSIGPAIPMEKASEVVQVLVKPLPIPKPESFTGAVGQFSLETLTPPTNVKAGQPFSLVVNITGLGNLKAIEAPKIQFPAKLDLTNMASHPGVMDERGSGTIQFEYLLNPREAGEAPIPETEWSYFDPAKAEYRRLKIPALAISIGAGAANNTNGNDEPTAAPQKPREWIDLAAPPAHERSVPLHEVGDPMFFGSHTVFGIHLLALVAFLTMLWRRKRGEERDTFLKTYPWTHLEEEFLANQKFSARKLAEKLDQWSRLRLVGYLKAAHIEHQLHSESSRGDFAQVLKQNLSPENYKILDTLKAYWAELDSMRFSGKSAEAEMASKAPFEKARAALSQIEKSLRKSEKKLYQGFQDEWS